MRQPLCSFTGLHLACNCEDMESLHIYTMESVYITEYNKNGVSFHELSLGWYDPARDYLRNGDRAFAGSVGGGDSVFEGGSESVCGDGRGYGALGGDDADCRRLRAFGGDGAADAPGPELPVSRDSEESSGKKIHCDQSAGECSGTWLGGDTCRTEGDGRTGGSGGRTAKEKATGGANRSSQQRDVRFPDPEYFLPAADSSQYHCFPDGVWKCDTDGDRGAGDPCDGDQYGGDGGVLQGDG